MNGLTQIDDPREHGKFLVNSRTASIRYRIGDYRVLCNIIDSELTILAINVGKRSEIYSQL